MKEILIFEDIEQGHAKEIAAQIQDETDILIKINSCGGNLFEAVTIYNLLKNKNTNVEISGLCASAATIIACAGKKVSMYENALFAIHEPGLLLVDYYTADDLAKLQTTLEKMTATINQIYQSRVPGFTVEDELWLEADEALSMGFVDEIIPGGDEIQIENNLIRSGNLQFDASRFKNFKEVRNMIEVKNVRNAELERLRGLNDLRGTNAAVNAVLDVAIKRDISVAVARELVQALEKIPAAQNNFADVIKDQMHSGAAEVSGQLMTDAEMRKARLKRIADSINK